MLCLHHVEPVGHYGLVTLWRWIVGSMLPTGDLGRPRTEPPFHAITYTSAYHSQ